MRKLWILLPLSLLLLTFPVFADGNPTFHLQINETPESNNTGGNNNYVRRANPEPEKQARLSSPILERDFDCSFYSTYLLKGRTTATNQSISVNGISEEITYFNDNQFQSLIPLNSGGNSFFIQSHLQNEYSPAVSLFVQKLELGDSDNNKLVDDYDLSLVASHWNSNTCEEDYNNDGIVDDYDLSILASHWNIHY